MPWRSTRAPYRILVSEVMLQQTGVERVMAKYGPFIRAFPSFRALAAAPVADVMAAWKGLGYNRRALALHEAAIIVAAERHGSLPRTIDELAALPGIGRATAAAVLVYAYNMPLAFIETNVRRSFIHHFFPEARSVTDGEILPLVEQCLDRKNPREWYYALMDYGTMLGRDGANANRKSARYRRQSAFEGSLRQLRGKILSVMLERKSATLRYLSSALEDARVEHALQQLVAEGFLARRGGRYSFK